jgi:hypothetical protein
MSTPTGEPTPVYFVATCRTEGCVVQDQGFRMPFYPNAVAPIYRGVCGQCGQTVTDLVAAP